MASTLEKGRKIGPYEILEPLGKGGMATVYRAYQPSLEREVAIKVMAEQYTDDAAFAERFRREARSIARLRHPNILTVYDAGEDANLLYIVMELIDGPTLKDVINGQPIELEKALTYTNQIAGALDYANKNGIIHRDVKPSNVLIEQNGRAVLSDFGIAKLADQNQLTGTGVGVGTPDYMSPEQATGDNLDARSDQYSLGIVVYEMLTGKPPYSGDTPIAVVMGHVSKPLPSVMALNPLISASVEAVLIKALAKKASDRYESSGAFALALSQAAQEPVANTVKPATNVETNLNNGEVEGLYNEARRQEQQNNYIGAFNSFVSLNNRFPNYRDVPQIIQRYQATGYGQQYPQQQQQPAYRPPANNMYQQPQQPTYRPNPNHVKSTKKFPIVPVLSIVGLLVVVVLGGITCSFIGSRTGRTTVSANKTPVALTVAPMFTTRPLVPGSNTPRPINNLKFRSYDDPQGRWRLNVPQDWSADESDSDGETISFSPTDNKNLALEIFSIEAGAELAKLDTFYQVFKEQFEAGGATIKKEDKTRLDGQDGVFYTGTFSDDTGSANMKLIGIPKSGRFYMLLYTGFANENIEKDLIIDQVISSFRFK